MSANFSTLSDEELVARLQADDVAAFTALYNRYWKRLLAKAHARLNDFSEAEETVQDIFIRLWNRRQELELRFSFTTYIHAALRYELLTRAAKAQPHTSLEASELIALSDARTPDSLFEAEELRVEIDRAVNALPEKCQLVFRLSRDEGLSRRQVAQQLGIAEKTVEAHLTKALKALRDTLLRLVRLPGLRVSNARIGALCYPYFKNISSFF